MPEQYIRRTIELLKTFPLEDPAYEMGFHLTELEEILEWKKAYDSSISTVTEETQ